MSAESDYFKIKTQVFTEKQASILQSTALSLGSGQEGERGRRRPALNFGTRTKRHKNVNRNKARNPTTQTHRGDDSAATEGDWTYPPWRASVYSRNSKLVTLQLLMAQVCVPVGMQANMKSN